MKIQKLEALLRRLPEQFPKTKQIEDELAKCLAGYRGEQSLDYHLSFLEEKKYLILHDLRLADEENRYFQLDTLIISSRFFLILEVKNISGTLFFDQSFNQLIRSVNGKEEAFRDPILQVNRQQQQLEAWLLKNKLPLMPILTLIVISNPTTIIKTETQHKQIPEKVIHAEKLVYKIELFNQFYKRDIVSPTELKRISRLLLKQHEPANQNILTLFQIEPSEIQTGVHCPKCFALPMSRHWGKWMCPQCYFTAKDAHIPTLNDYALLFGTTITNNQMKEFLQMPSISGTSKMLSKLNLQYKGDFRHRKYTLPQGE